jgi:hypothetical protein
MTPENLLQKDEKKEVQIDQPRDQRRFLSPTFVSAMIIGIVMLIVLIHVGFFNTYIKFFPKFDDVNVDGYTVHFNAVKHFHGMMLMGWVLMLLVQPILIRKGKMKLHRQVGHLSYVLAPLVLLSLLLINQHAYHQVLQAAGESQAVALIALVFPAFFFAVLYFLAIRYRDRPPLHMRFMCSTAFLFIPPALDRSLIHYLGLPGYDVGSIIELSIIGAVTIIDSLKTKRLSPFTLVFSFEVLHTILWHSRETDLWQSVGSIIVKMF